MAVARSIAVAAGRDLDAVELARLIGRGQRSAVGIHGFAHGGLLVEGGKRSADAIAPLIAGMAFPTAWRILLVIPQELHGDHGPREEAAFRALAGGSADLRRTEALCRLVLLGMLPALAERDLDGFGEALYDFNRRAGEWFRAWQGDLYAHPRITQLVEAIRGTGLARGVGQSSWGPTVFAIVAADVAHELHHWLLRQRACAAEEMIVTPAANGGAVAIL
jgi:beta-RFAP synthase